MTVVPQEPQTRPVPRSVEALLVLGAILLGLVLGVLASLGLAPVLVVAALAAPVVAGVTILRPDLGLVVLAVMVYTHVSDVAVNQHGTPSLLQPYLALLLVSILVHAVWSGRLPKGLWRPMGLLSAYGLVIGSSLLFYVPEFDLAYEGVNFWLRDAVIALLAVALLRRGRTLEQLLTGLLVAGAVLAAMGVLQYVTGSFGQDFGGFAQASIKNIAGSDSDYRISGPIADPNHYAQAVLVLVPLALGRMRRGRSPSERLLGGIALGLFSLVLVFTFSRGALVALALLLVIAIALHPPPLKAVLAVSVAGAALAVLFLPPGYADRLGSLGEALPGGGSGGGRPGEASLSGRLSAVTAGKDMFLDRPVAGVGLNQFTAYYREYSLGKGIDTVESGLEPHNLYVEVAAETGFLGVITFGAIVGTALMRLRRGRRDLQESGHDHHAGLLSDLSLAIVAYLLSGLFVHNAYPRFFYLLIGVAWATPAVVQELRSRRAATAVPGAGTAAQLPYAAAHSPR